MIVHNDFHQSHGIFSLFDKLEVENMDQPTDLHQFTNGDDTNGLTNGHSANGYSTNEQSTNGHSVNGHYTDAHKTNGLFADEHPTALT